MRNRAGFALLLSLLLTLALSMLALGAMATAIRETALARTLRMREEARARAEAVVAAAVEQWSTGAYAHLPVGGDTALPGSGTELEILRVEPALYAVRGAARSAAGGAVGRAGLLVRTFDPDDALARLPAAVTVDADARVETGTVSGRDGCGPDVPAVVGPSVTVEAGGLLLGSVPFRFERPVAPPITPELATALGPLDVEPGAIVPGPAAGSGSCTPAPDNWGAADAGHACHGLLPIVLIRGSAHVAGGEGRGVLVVEKDLVLDAGVRFEGLIVVGGRTTIDGGSRVHGAIRTGRFELRDGVVQRSSCALRDVLSAPALDRAFRPPGRWWIPVF